MNHFLLIKGSAETPAGWLAASRLMIGHWAEGRVAAVQNFSEIFDGEGCWAEGCVVGCQNFK